MIPHPAERARLPLACGCVKVCDNYDLLEAYCDYHKRMEPTL